MPIAFQTGMLEEIVARFPVRVELEDGAPCSLRPPVATDEAAVQAFHQVIPEREQLFIRREIQDGTLFQRWLKDPDFEKQLPLLAFVDGEVCAMGVLRQRPGGWKRHIGRVSFLTHPDYRGLGLISHLATQLVDASRMTGLTKLESEVNGERASAIKSMVAAGFVELVRLPGYVQDMEAQYHDYVLMGMDLVPDMEHLAAGD